MNITTHNIAKLLIEKLDQIASFAIDPIIGCLEIDG